ncbi:MAG: DNA repair protein RecN [Clostridiales bacterium]|nr:DNA repair protein RecN [Clostridiales bacterium]
MLSVLHIENIAVIESAEIQFDRGFNALTGETGAGKSIVVDAIGAVLGGRTSRDLIRTGAKSALVSATFTELPNLDWFAENGVGPDEEGNLLLQRELRLDGKNLCRLNGRPVPLAQLRELGRQLLNIHGQHDGQQLLDPECHLSYLDSYGETSPLLAEFQQAYHQVAALKKQISALQMDEAEKARRIDSLTYQIDELERANLKPGEDKELTERRNLLRNAGKLMDAIDTAYYALYGGDDRDGAISLVETAEEALRAGGRYSQELADLGESLSELRYSLTDAADRVQEKKEGLDISPRELDELESRLDLIYRLRKKYGATVEEMLAYLERSKQELETIQYSSDRIEHLTRQLVGALREAAARGKKLTAARKECARSLEQRIQKELADLDMPKVRFQVQFSPKEGSFHMDETGMDQVQFLMSANVGEDLKPIHKIASGGELSRIMLALKNVLAENESITTLVFDEVDTGVSGRAASKVARKMADVARHKQVLAVTHLPQIAAMADVHFSVEKGERNGRTYTDVERLTPQRRREELARLTGGSVVTPALLKSAGELLEQSEAYRRELRGEGQ